MHLTYGRKTTASIPKFEFPKFFKWSANPRHHSNTDESLKLLDKVIISYVNSDTVSKVSKYGVISSLYFLVFSPNTGKFGPEITPYLDTFYAVWTWEFRFWRITVWFIGDERFWWSNENTCKKTKKKTLTVIFYYS